MRRPSSSQSTRDGAPSGSCKAIWIGKSLAYESGSVSYRRVSSLSKHVIWNLNSLQCCSAHVQRATRGSWSSASITNEPSLSVTVRPISILPDWLGPHASAKPSLGITAMTVTPAKGNSPPSSDIRPRILRFDIEPSSMDAGPSQFVLGLADAAPSGMMLSNQAARSKSWSEGFSARLSQPSTFRS